MDIKDIDLNLLKAFDALLRMRHVTKAGTAVGLSQPAMSFALAKLRTLFGDPLFVRTSQGMEPTSRAAELAEPVRRMLELVRSEILPQPEFIPADTDRIFALNLSDVGEMVFLPRLLKRFDTSAPSARVKVVAVAAGQLEIALGAGDVDLAIGYFPNIKSANIHRRSLYRHSFVCIMRADHPQIGDSLSLEQFAAAPHLVVQPEGRSQEVFEAALVKHGIQRRIRFNLQRFTGVPNLIAESEMIAAVPLAVGRRFARLYNIKALPLPFEVPEYDLCQYWHARFHHDPANRWLRQLMPELVADFPEAPPTSAA
jgi:DNA-binding transcriptional LysR family regulator